MALRNLQELVNHGSLTPNSEAGRINAIVANRRLYEGDFTALNLGTVDEGIPGISINWFLIASNFYSRFVLNPRPVVTIEGQPRAQEWVDTINRDVWRVMQTALLDAIRYGYGVLTTHPMDPSQPWSMEPDAHYVVVDAQGKTTQDLFVRKRAASSSEAEQGRRVQKDLHADNDTVLDIYVYDIDGTVKRRTYGYASGGLGVFLGETDLPSRAKGRQVVELSIDDQRTSMFDVLKPHVSAIGRALTGLGRGVKRNSRPHLSGPVGNLAVGNDGKRVLDPDGQLLERSNDDPAWEYVEWTNDPIPVRADIDLHTEGVFASSGLSRFLFSSDGRQNIFRASATSLRRLMVPFATRVTEMRDAVEDAYERELDILNRSRGSEIFAIPNRDVSIYFPYEELWQSDDPQDNDDGGDLNAGGENGRTD